MCWGRCRSWRRQTASSRQSERQGPRPLPPLLLWVVVLLRCNASQPLEYGSPIERRGTFTNHQCCGPTLCRLAGLRWEATTLTELKAAVEAAHNRSAELSEVSGRGSLQRCWRRGTAQELAVCCRQLPEHAAQQIRWHAQHATLSNRHVGALPLLRAQELARSAGSLDAAQRQLAELQEERLELKARCGQPQVCLSQLRVSVVS